MSNILQFQDFKCDKCDFFGVFVRKMCYSTLEKHCRILFCWSTTQWIDFQYCFCIKNTGTLLISKIKCQIFSNFRMSNVIFLAFLLEKCVILLSKMIAEYFSVDQQINNWLLVLFLHKTKYRSTQKYILKKTHRNVFFQKSWACYTR